MAFVRFIAVVLALILILTLAGVGLIVLFGKEKSGFDISSIFSSKAPESVYRNSDLGLSFSYPSPWTRENISGTMIKFSDGAKAMIVESKEFDKEKKYSLEEYTRENLREIGESAEESGFSIVMEQPIPTTLGGKEALRLTVVMQKEEQMARVVQVWALKDNRVYLFSFSAPLNEYGEAVQMFENVIRSVEIK